MAANLVLSFFSNYCDEHNNKMLAKGEKSMLSFIFVLFIATSASIQVDYSQYVNPLIGSEGPIPGLATGGG